MLRLKTIVSEAGNNSTMPVHAEGKLLHGIAAIQLALALPSSCKNWRNVSESKQAKSIQLKNLHL